MEENPGGPPNPRPCPALVAALSDEKSHSEVWLEATVETCGICHL